jgi:hypothetical protein
MKSHLGQAGLVPKKGPLSSEVDPFLSRVDMLKGVAGNNGTVQNHCNHCSNILHINDLHSIVAKFHAYHMIMCKEWDQADCTVR